MIVKPVCRCVQHMGDDADSACSGHYDVRGIDSKLSLSVPPDMLLVFATSIQVWWWLPRESVHGFKAYAERMTEGGRGELYTKSISPFLTDREERPPEQVLPLQVSTPPACLGWLPACFLWFIWVAALQVDLHVVCPPFRNPCMYSMQASCLPSDCARKYAAGLSGLYALFSCTCRSF